MPRKSSSGLEKHAMLPASKLRKSSSYLAAILAAQSVSSVKAQFFNNSANGVATNGYMTYYSSPAEPPTLSYLLNVNSSTAADVTLGYFFLCPDADVPQIGPTIYSADTQLVWSGHLMGYQNSSTFGPQTYKNETLLTVFVNAGPQPLGHGNGTYVLLNNRYEPVFNITGGFRGYGADVHECIITPQNTVVTTSYPSIPYNLSAYGGPENGWLADSQIQEIDPETGKQLFTWNPLDHVNLSDAHVPFIPGMNGSSPTAAWDPIHLNSAQKMDNGNYLISSRHYSTIFYVDGKTGDVIWRLGGQNSSFSMPEGSQFYFQHDARFPYQNLSSVSMFDNGASNWVTIQNVSTGLWLDLDYDNMAVSVKHRYSLYANKSTPYTGSMQVTNKSNVFIGQGIVNVFAEYDEAGAPLYALQFGSTTSGGSSYRTFKSPEWHGYPTTNPDLVVFPGNSTAYVSWNGATDVSTWALRGSNDNQAYTAVANQTSTGFETRISLGNSNFTNYMVEAYDSAGKLLGSSNGSGMKSQAKRQSRTVVTFV